MSLHRQNRCKNHQSRSWGTDRNKKRCTDILTDKDLTHLLFMVSSQELQVKEGRIAQVPTSSCLSQTHSKLRPLRFEGTCHCWCHCSSDILWETFIKKGSLGQCGDKMEGTNTLHCVTIFSHLKEAKDTANSLYLWFSKESHPKYLLIIKYVISKCLNDTAIADYLKSSFRTK